MSHRIEGPVALLIGQGEMPVQCAKMLVRHGFDIAGVHSPDAPLRAWAERNNNPNSFESFEHFRHWGETILYDYLFSVVNFNILQPPLFGRALRAAINYHDAPLPRYAGSNATEWALYNGEKEHGITWHIIGEQVDAGDILKQRTFPIDPGETKASLDRKCYLYAMRAFDELLRDLKVDRIERTPQDLSRRTFYYRHQRPGANPNGPSGREGRP